ncbi:Thymidylate kinase [Stackebrandtia soli]
MSGVSDLKATLRIRPFRRLWAVLGLSAIGDWLGLLASAIFAAAQFNNSTAQGAAFSSVVVVRLLPSIVLGPLSGIFADRWDRRITMAVCDLLRFGLFLSMPLVALWAGTGLGAATWIVVAQFLVEAVGMMWMPAKEAAVPNLLPKARLEAANQLTLITTYGLAPVAASGLLAFLESPLIARPLGDLGDWAAPSAIGLYVNAFTFLASAAVVYFGIPEVSIRKITPGSELTTAKHTGMVREFADGWRYVARTTMVRGLVIGIMGAFAGAGVIIGTGNFYARTLGGGQATFNLLFATIFVGIGIGVALGPVIVKDLSRKRLFGMSIVLAGIGLFVNAIAPHVSIALIGTAVVGAGAGMAFLAGITLLGREVDDTVRGRIFAFISTGARVVLMVSVAGAGLIAGFGSSRQVDLGLFTYDLSFSRLLLLIAAVLAVAVGIASFRQMDDKPGVPILADLWGSIRGRPLSPGTPAERGFFVVFEGGEGSGKSTQSVKLAARLRLRGHEVVLTREPGATELGTRIRTLVLDPESGMWPSPRAEALLYAADRAQHVAKVVRPALDASSVVISDRYIDSSLAYQGGGRAMPSEEIAWLSNWATGGLRPNLVVLLDIDPAEGLRRATSGGADRLERESLAFHEKVRYKFQDLASEDPSRYLVIDGSLPPDEIAAKVNERVEQLLAAPDAPHNASGWPLYDGSDDRPAPTDPDATVVMPKATDPGARPDPSPAQDEPEAEPAPDTADEEPPAPEPEPPATLSAPPPDTTPISDPRDEGTPSDNGSTTPDRPRRVPGLDETALFPRVNGTIPIDPPDATAIMPTVDDPRAGTIAGTEFDEPPTDHIHFRQGRVSP